MMHYEHKFNTATNDINWRIISNIINTKNRKVENTVNKLLQNDAGNEDSEDMANIWLKKYC